MMTLLAAVKLSPLQGAQVSTPFVFQGVERARRMDVHSSSLRRDQKDVDIGVGLKLVDHPHSILARNAAVKEAVAVALEIDEKLDIVTQRGQREVHRSKKRSGQGKQRTSMILSSLTDSLKIRTLFVDGWLLGRLIAKVDLISSYRNMRTCCE